MNAIGNENAFDGWRKLNSRIT